MFQSIKLHGHDKNMKNNNVTIPFPKIYIQNIFSVENLPNLCAAMYITGRVLNLK